MTLHGRIVSDEESIFTPVLVLHFGLRLLGLKLSLLRCLSCDYHLISCGASQGVVEKGHGVIEKERTCLALCVCCIAVAWGSA